MNNLPQNVAGLKTDLEVPVSGSVGGGGNEAAAVEAGGKAVQSC